VTNIRATYRLLLFAFGSFYFIFRYLIKAAFVGNNLDRALRLRKQWFSLINNFVGIEMEIYGEEPKQAGLLVSNHRSYFDPLLVMQFILALPVGKAEVQNWPIIGYGAKVSGSIFVDRKTKVGRSKARKDILSKLRNGYFVLNYPEGTTHTKAQTQDFKPGLFRDAASEGFIIYPIALEYQSSSDAWVGDDTFIKHFYTCFGKQKTRVRLSYGPALRSESHEELIQLSKQWINKELLALREKWHQDDLPINANAKERLV